ncbi:MAG: LacI family DNA-binding transcriptional regulator [Anaerolineae bacterium]|nr:LacI family DNA-binding transcriptional regulator [Anaerolineae bacterium]
MATIYDVAKEAGVSTATVSKALSNTPYVSEETRARVLAVVERLNYVPSLAARGLTKARTYIIGLVIPYVSDYLFSDPHLLEFIRGVEQEANARDYNLLLATARAPSEAASAYQRLLRTQYVDGAVLVAVRRGEPDSLGVGKMDYPCVALGYHSPYGPDNTVHADDRQGALKAVRHLLDLGHRGIGVISGPPPLTAVEERLAGYRLALAERGVACDEGWFVQGDFTPESGFQAAAILLERCPQLTAIFCINDRMAMGAIQRLRAEGLRVPDDIAVVGFDDIPSAALFEPPLTTVRQPALEMGRIAAHKLFQLIGREIESFESIVLPAELIVRASSGNARR